MQSEEGYREYLLTCCNTSASAVSGVSPRDRDIIFESAFITMCTALYGAEAIDGRRLGDNSYLRMYDIMLPHIKRHQQRRREDV